MNMETLIAAGLNALLGILANHLNKPPGWIPTQQDLIDFLGQVDQSTPEAEKAAARIRLGLPPVEPESPS